MTEPTGLAGGDVEFTDRRLMHRRGRIFVRSWVPADLTGAARPSPIVLFHDSLGCVELWRTFPALLARRTGRPVIAYDRLGFGGSDRRSDTLSRSFVQEEAELFFPILREQLGFDRFIAFGHSVGGGMAVHCAAAYPAACEALVTEAAQVFVEDRTREGILVAKRQFQQPETFQRLQRYHGDKARWVLDAWIGTWLAPEFADWTLEAVLPQVGCPTLAIHGGEDEYGSAVHPERIVRLVSGPAQLLLIPGIGHVPHREQEQQVAERVADFIRTHCA